ncbi:hypothetical protein M413DRAFT_28419 [Hebeloma cylindrosporum]|uniref:Uncharacterized protein n=1 Tax=Hebeloma cylindrosporum TaxID=76867 RepID=A0A0C3BVJ8_HEBCY|nr:hypothetical protein M413DRAFT_28419 [Hebeloma cylindrosporum h7]
MGQQVCELSGSKTVILRTPRGSSLQLQYKSRLENREYFQLPFPPGTKGVFYHHLPPGIPPQAGELRFKKCESVQGFSYGEDLQVDAGQHWSLPLINIVQSAPRQAYLNELLVEPGLVDRGLVADLQRLVRDQTKDKGGFSSTTLYDIDQPFIIDLQLTTFNGRLVTRQSLKVIRHLGFWRTLKCQPPFHGRVRVRFELAGSPGKDGRLKLHLRILDILKPIEHRIVQNWVPEPRAGELLLRREKKGPGFVPWTYSPYTGGHIHKALVEFLQCRAADKAKYGV